jgi:hypothetical protein
MTMGIPDFITVNHAVAMGEAGMPALDKSHVAQLSEVGQLPRDGTGTRRRASEYQGPLVPEGILYRMPFG